MEEECADFIMAHIEFIDIQKDKIVHKDPVDEMESITNNTIMVGGQMHDYSKLETP